MTDDRARPTNAVPTGVVPTTVVLAEATRALAGSTSPGAEARTLLAHVLGVDPSRLVLVATVGATDRERLGELLQRRRAGTPVQHLTGRAWFRTVSLEVGPGVFVPRPETEVMTGWVVEHLGTLVAQGHTPVVIDAGTGSGAIAKAIAAEVPTARVHACELSEDAHEHARRNLTGTGVDLVCADFAEAFEELVGEVDVVVSNPPYIPLEAWESVTAEVRDHDPALALWSGDDGLDAMRVLADRAARWLRSGGVVAAEHAEVQHESAPAVFVDDRRYDQVRDHPDLTDRPRFLTARRR